MISHMSHSSLRQIEALEDLWRGKPRDASERLTRARARANARGNFAPVLCPNLKAWPRPLRFSFFRGNSGDHSGVSDPPGFRFIFSARQGFIIHASVHLSRYLLKLSLRNCVKA